MTSAISQGTARPEERYLAAFESFERNGSARDPSWLRELRRTAISRFESLGFPTARRGNEEWKYTDVGPIVRTPFASLTPDGPAQAELREVERFAFGAASWSQLVFVDGVYCQELSRVASLPRGVQVLSLAEALAGHGPLLESHLARHADYESYAFTALNTAFFQHGAFLYVPDGTVVETPIHLLFLSRARHAVSHPRVLVVLGRESVATVGESYGGLSRERYLTNAVSEVVLGPGAVLNYCRIQRQGERAFHIGSAQVVQGRESTFNSVTMDVGGELVRNNLNVVMAGEGASCSLNGLYLVNGTQHVDNQIIVDHTQPNTTSRELYKGILDGRSRAVFHGSIIVRKGAQKVDAHQVDRNLLLSNQAEAYTKPAFWIYADDVKCGHGAACGQLDENALFYLRSRGLDQATARRYLVRAFAAEVLNAAPRQPFRAHLEKLLSTALAGFQIGGNDKDEDGGPSRGDGDAD